jgi:hypothetical protein
MRQEVVDVLRARLDAIAPESPGNGAVAAAVEEAAQLRRGAVGAHESGYGHDGVSVALGQRLQQWAEQRGTAHFQQYAREFQHAVPQSRRA